METIYKPERQEGESFSDYQARRIIMQEKLKSHKRGTLVWAATETYNISSTLQGTRPVKGTFVGNVKRDLK